MNKGTTVAEILAARASRRAISEGLRVEGAAEIDGGGTGGGTKAITYGGISTRYIIVPNVLK